VGVVARTTHKAMLRQLEGCAVSGDGGGMPNQHRVAELTWVFRPGATRSAQVRALAGRPIHATGPVGPDGEAEVVLNDGTQLRATAAEIVAEQRSAHEG
jgi:hypothetical protein